MYMNVPAYVYNPCIYTYAYMCIYISMYLPFKYPGWTALFYPRWPPNPRHRRSILECKWRYVGDFQESNLGPLVLRAIIIPLDQNPLGWLTAVVLLYLPTSRISDPTWMFSWLERELAELIAPPRRRDSDNTRLTLSLMPALSYRINHSVVSINVPLMSYAITDWLILYLALTRSSVSPEGCRLTSLAAILVLVHAQSESLIISPNLLFFLRVFWPEGPRKKLLFSWTKMLM